MRYEPGFRGHQQSSTPTNVLVPEPVTEASKGAAPVQLHPTNVDVGDGSFQLSAKETAFGAVCPESSSSNTAPLVQALKSRKVSNNLPSPSSRYFPTDDGALGAGGQQSGLYNQHPPHAMKIEFGPDMPDVTTETLTFPHPDVTGGVVWTPAGGFPDPALLTTTKDPWSIFNEVHSSITPAAVSEILVLEAGVAKQPANNAEAASEPSNKVHTNNDAKKASILLKMAAKKHGSSQQKTTVVIFKKPAGTTAKALTTKSASKASKAKAKARKLAKMKLTTRFVLLTTTEAKKDVVEEKTTTQRGGSTTTTKLSSTKSKDKSNKETTTKPSTVAGKAVAKKTREEVTSTTEDTDEAAEKARANPLPTITSSTDAATQAPGVTATSIPSSTTVDLTSYNSDSSRNKSAEERSTTAAGSKVARAVSTVSKINGKMRLTTRRGFDATRTSQETAAVTTSGVSTRASATVTTSQITKVS
jgi:hypothetical protein